MATILEFRVTEHNGARNEAPAEGALGEIIIFPGVRIERHDAHERTMTAAHEDPPSEPRSKSRA